MKILKLSLVSMALISATLFTSAGVEARDDINKFNIKELLETTKAKEALLDIPLYFGESATPKVVEKWGSVSTNKKTNAFMKSDKEACQWVMLSALKALQERARKEGMNAVINIQSNYKKREFISSEEFECGAGAIMAGVALKGTLVSFDNKS